MRCPYQFKAEDKPVQDGRRQIGEVCNAPSGKKSYGGNCFPHAVHLGLVPQDVIDKKNEKLRETHRKKMARISARSKENLEKSSDNLSETTKEILGVMGKNDPYDLSYEYALLKQLNPEPQNEKYAEKFAFAMWLNTPESVREPKSLLEAATILGVAEPTLALWRRSPELVRIFNNKAKETACRSYPYIIEKALERVAVGSERAMDILLKHIKEIQADTEPKSKIPLLSAALIAEAKNINEDGKTSKIEGVANHTLKAAQYDALTDGAVKVDTVQ
jgi:hypothetical protein